MLQWLGMSWMDEILLISDRKQNFPYTSASKFALGPILPLVSWH
jgi:hypothetical protein